MKSKGLRHLRAHLSAITRQIQQRATISITRRGEPIASIIPTDHHSPTNDVEPIFTDLDALAAEIGSRWTTNRTALDAVQDVRRDL